MKTRTVLAALILAGAGALAGATQAHGSSTLPPEYTVCAHLGHDIVAYKLCRQALHWDPRTGQADLARCEALYPNRTGLATRQKFYVCEAFITDRRSV